MMDDNQKVLSTYQHFNTINLYKSESDEDDGYDTIPKMTMKSQDLIQEYHQTIDRFLRKYAAKTMSVEDYRLMNGVFTPKTLKNKEVHEMGVNLYGGHNSGDDRIQRDRTGQCELEDDSVVSFGNDDQVMPNELRKNMNFASNMNNSKITQNHKPEISLMKILKGYDQEESKHQ